MPVCTFLCLHVTSLCDMADCQWCMRISCYYWRLSSDHFLCGHTITGLVQCCQHHLIGYYTLSLERSNSLLFYQDIDDFNHQVKSFKDSSMKMKTLIFFAEFIIIFLIWLQGYHSVILLFSGGLEFL